MVNENLETSDASEHASSQAAVPESSQAAEKVTESVQENLEALLDFKELAVGSVESAMIATFNKDRYVDRDTIESVGNELYKLLPLTLTLHIKADGIILDFSGVSFISSSFINKLIIFQKKAHESGLCVKFCSLQPDILEAFRISSLNKYFSIVDDREAALTSFASESNGGSGGT